MFSTSCKRVLTSESFQILFWINVLVEAIVYYWFAYKRFKSAFRIEGDSYLVGARLSAENDRCSVDPRVDTREDSHQQVDYGV